jgi:ABC-type phosphate transport system substrate-binding protein
MALLNQRQVLQCGALAALLLISFSVFAEVCVVTSAKSPPITLNKNQVSDVFLGKVTSLPDGSNATPIDQPESSQLRDEFYFKVANKSVTQAKAHWEILHFTGRGMPPREGTGSAEIKKILNAIPGAIGYIERSSLDNTVKIIYVAQ